MGTIFVNLLKEIIYKYNILIQCKSKFKKKYNIYTIFWCSIKVSFKEKNIIYVHY